MRRAPSLNMLEKRAQYADDAKDAATLTLSVSQDGNPIPTKTEPRVRKVWIHPFEMETGDYFWGDDEPKPAAAPKKAKSP
jgi:hypothetical protein